MVGVHYGMPKSWEMKGRGLPMGGSMMDEIGEER